MIMYDPTPPSELDYHKAALKFNAVVEDVVNSQNDIITEIGRRTTIVEVRPFLMRMRGLGDTIEPWDESFGKFGKFVDLDKRRAKAFFKGAALGLLLADALHPEMTLRGEITGRSLVSEIQDEGLLTGGGAYIDDKHARAERTLDIGSEQLEYMGTSAADIIDDVSMLVEDDVVHQITVKKAIAFTAAMADRLHKKAYVRQGNARLDALVGNSKAFDAGLAALLG